MGSDQQGANQIHGRWLLIPRTLCFITHNDNVLLMKRSATRRIFPNLYNGVGGHIERWEDPLEAAKREILEETGLPITNLLLRGVHNIDVGHVNGILMFVFTATSPTEHFVDSGNEGTLHWIPVNRVYELELVEDLPIILPRVIQMPSNAVPYFAHVSYDDRDMIQIRFSNEHS